MKLDAFTDELYSAGWTSPNDGQHGNIKLLWAKIFPDSAQAEDDLQELREANDDMLERLLKVSDLEEMKTEIHKVL